MVCIVPALVLITVVITAMRITKLQSENLIYLSRHDPLLIEDTNAHQGSGISVADNLEATDVQTALTDSGR